jgi:virulence-associated protein E/VirE-like protein
MSNLSESRMSFFNEPISNIIKDRDISIPDVVQLIKSEKYEKRTSFMRSLQNKKQRDEYKINNFPYVTSSGIFLNRKNESLIKHSGLMTIDFDSLGSDLHRIKSIIISDPNTKNSFVMLFISPSGDGLKVTYHIDTSLHTQKEYYEAISKYLSTLCGIPASHLDQSCKDVSRACFICHDPDMHLNPNWNKDFMEPFPITNDLLETKSELIAQYKPIQLPSHVMEKCKNYTVKKLKKIVRDSKDGQKDTELNKAAFFAGGCVAGGIITEEDARETLQSAIKQKPSVINLDAAFRTIETGIKSGKEKPISIDKLGINKTTLFSTTDHVFDRITQFLIKYYSLKRNEIDLRIENDGKSLNEHELNSVYIHCSKVIGQVTKYDFDIYTNSDEIPKYNPLKDFISAHKLTINTNYIEKLASCFDCVKGHHYAYTFLKRFLIGLVASIFDKNYNVLFLIIVGGKNIGKTYFFRNLLPDELQAFYAESKLDQGKDSNILMCERLLILNDELDGLSKGDSKTFRRFISSFEFTERPPYGRQSVTRKRLASLCGTSNDHNIIQDPDNNRRMIPIEVTKIDHVLYNSIDKKALFMEAYNLYEAGERWELSKEEIQLLNDNTDEYGVQSIERALIDQCFSVPSESEEDKAEKLTATQILLIIEPKTKHRINENNVGKALKVLGFSKKMRKIPGGRSNEQVYSVVRKSNDEHGFGPM